MAVTAFRDKVFRARVDREAPEVLVGADLAEAEAVAADSARTWRGRRWRRSKTGTRTARHRRTVGSATRPAPACQPHAL